MSNARSLGNRGNFFVRLMSVVKTYSSQIGVVGVAAALGLAIVLNIAMASETTSEKAQAQMAYLKKDPSEKSTSIY